MSNMKEVQSFHPMQQYRHLMNRIETNHTRRRFLEHEKAILLREINEKLLRIKNEVQSLDAQEIELMEEGRTLVPELREFTKVQHILIDVVAPFFASR